MSSSFTSWIFTKRKFLFISLIVPMIFTFYYLSTIALNDVVNCLVMYKCRNPNFNDVDPKTLETIFKAKHKPQYNGKSIFFLETHINSNKTISLSARQACSVESAGKKIITLLDSSENSLFQLSQILITTFS